MPVTCGDIINGSVTVQETPVHVSVYENTFGVVSVSSPGPSGPKGDTGATGLSGAGEPFYAIVTGSLYATSASIAIFAGISSSLVPYTSSMVPGFDLGTLTSPWRSLYVSTQSIHFVSGGSVLASVGAVSGFVAIGESRIGTSSFGFSSEIITNRGSYIDTRFTGSLSITIDGTHDAVTVSSQSMDYITIDDKGIFIFGQFSYLPTPVPGGMIFSGSDFYLGK